MTGVPHKLVEAQTQGHMVVACLLLELPRRVAAMIWPLHWQLH